MATFIPDPGTNFSVGDEPAIVTRLKALAAAIGQNIYGISGYRSPAHSVAVGGSANDPHTRGQAADIGIGSSSRASAAQVSEATLEKFGLTRPFDLSGDPNNPEVNHVQLFGKSTRTRTVGGSGGNETLSQLWIQAGGDPHKANLMAAIAMAESSGRSGATNKNTNGTTDYGLWQINSVHSQFDPQKLLSDPLYNAEAAVSIEKSQGLGAWTTYTSGAYKQYLSPAAQTKVNYGGPNGGRVRPGGSTPTGPTPEAALDQYVSLKDSPRTAPPGTKNPFAWWQASFTGNWSNLGN